VSATPVAASVGPTGIVIEFYEKPRRHYRITQPDVGKVPSVTTVIGATVDKGEALQYYAANQTCDGVVQLVKETGRIPNQGWKLSEQLRERGLNFAAQTRRAQKRGVRIHDMIEAWGKSETIPNPSDFPSSDRGYITAFAKFFREREPKFVACELLVGSAQHGFAGRLDTIAVFVLDGCITLVDFKTSKRLYPKQHLAQLDGYAIGVRECGYANPEAHAVVRLDKEGDYEVLLVEEAHPERFLSYLAAYRAQHDYQADARAIAKRDKAA
jgi:hypothetical protein